MLQSKSPDRGHGTGAYGSALDRGLAALGPRPEGISFTGAMALLKDDQQDGDDRLTLTLNLNLTLTLTLTLIG